ncbi:IQ calmodulin-binding domain-containing protein [Madurella fahalii]|uniref:IQ calmodulin-binding domain-containing protein n=1 Tax=Madurella fahalii TaxID=1157608 RepID=A0ABQ0G031_9PEZI
MATSVPLPLKAQIPVTPPPEFQMFMKGPSPQVHKPFAQDAAQATNSEQPEKTAQPTQPLRPQTQYRHSQKTPGPTRPIPPNPPPDPAATATFDPRYVAMASRIASYYQQRCQAVANFQQQRCQAWASVYRQKCQEMAQAAMVIVTWYIRDRIKRRRKRQKRAFKRGLARKAASVSTGRNGGMTRGESVRRWVMSVPLGAASPTSAGNRELPMDKEELDFDLDREAPADKDGQLFDMADNLIKSHLARIDMPLLGALSFVESESESESEEDEEEEEEEEDFMDYEDEGEEEDENEDYEDEEGSEMAKHDDAHEVRESGKGTGKETCISQDAQLGTTTKASRKRSRSSVS